MNYVNIVKANLNKNIYKVSDKGFKKYGRYTEMAEIEDLINDADKLSLEKNESITYYPSIEQLEKTKAAGLFEKKTFCGLPIEIGYLAGNNKITGSLEFHQGSQVVIACTDLLLALGNRWDMSKKHYDLNKCELFYMKKGECVELYSTTLHDIPIQVNDNGFEALIILIKGTNIGVVEGGSSISPSFNTFRVTHPDMKEEISKGLKPFLEGEIIEINY